MYCKLLPTLDQNTIILTANRRLSRYLLEQYAQYQIKAGLKAWLKPKILPLNTWLSHCWQHCESTDGFLLSDIQEEILWQKIIGLSPQTANLAKRAWQLIKSWDLSLNEIELEANSEVQCFVQWAYQFETELKKQNLINAVELPKQLKDLIPYISLPPQIILIGFDEFVPSIQKFLDAISKKTVISCYLTHHHKKPNVRRISFKEQEEEIQTMALWAYTNWKKNISKKIGCVIPNLTEYRSQIFRIFKSVIGSDKHFNISAGQPLAHLPLVKTALKILSLNPLNIELTELGTLFCSPYLNSTSDNSYLAAMLDVRLRETKRLYQTHSTILYHLHELEKKFPNSTLKTRYQKWLTLEHPQGALLPSEWLKHFTKELTALGWLGQRQLDSKEYQQLERWNKMLQEFVKFDNLILPQTRKQAIQLLWQLASTTLFQPKSDEDPPIQILGLLETTGLEFDSLWIMGLDNKNWPAAPNPNPFLPIYLQRRYQMPHSSFQRESAYASKIQQRLIKSASEVILSASLQDKEVQLSPSPLIIKFPEVTIEKLLLPFFETSTEKLFKTKYIEKKDDNQGPPLQKYEYIKGGSKILQSQSACPFQAFAQIRLQAKHLEQHKIGLSEIDRGNFLHQVLDVIWKKIKNWKSLINYSDSGLETLIEETINESSFSEDSIFFLVEKKRVKNLIKHWLLLEKKRPPFYVSQRETDRFVKIGQLSLRIRIDRIDTVMGGKLIIDYKTNNKNQVSDWLGNRLKNIQLPLYSSFSALNVVGVAYAEVTSKKISFKGWISEDKPFDNVTPAPIPWETLLNHWKTILNQLAIDFSVGKAEVNPFDKNTCKFCGLHSLCRVGE